MLMIGAKLMAQPVANFSANVTSGCVPLLVQFQDQSQGEIVSWSWSLGTSNSSIQNPVQLYTNGGAYSICLTVTDTAGLTSQHCETNYINAFSLPNIDFLAAPVNGCNPAPIQFTDLSTSPNGAAMASWQWTFGDGGASTQQNPSHTYTQVNSFNVTLNATDANGCSQSLTKVNYVSVVDPPVASFTAANTSNCDTPLTATFTNTSPNSGALAFVWNFGDGNTSVGFSPSHTYTTSGVYDVSLIATDVNTGCSDTATQTDLVDITTNLSVNYSPQSGCGTTTVNFTDQTPGGSSNWIWDFGNGDSAFVQNPSYTYTTTGCFTVTLTATDNNGCTSTYAIPNCIKISPIPTVSYSHAATSSLLGCDTPHVVSFSGSSNLNVSWLWNFGDGTTDTAQNPTHTFTSYGVFPVRLTVRTQDNCTNSIIIDTVKIQPIIADFTTDVQQGCTPLTVNFTDQSTSLTNITNWTWDFSTTTGSSTQNNSITFVDTGLYDIELIVENTLGCMDTLAISNLIGVGTPPNLSFNVPDTTVCVNDSVPFNNTSDAFAQTWFWNFGDNRTSQQAFPINQYQDTGYFSVTLTATHYSCPSTITYTDYIEVFPPKAIFSHEVLCDSPYTVVFTDASINADTWTWDFGDNTTQNDTSTLQNPTYTFPNRGDYQVTLLVNNNATGCTHELTRTIRIRDPKAIFVIPEDTICAGSIMPLVNNSLGAQSYQWTATGSNINNSASRTPNITYSHGYYDYWQLIVTDVNGCQDTMTLTDQLAVSDVFPSFTATPVAGCTPLTVNFTENSTTFLGTITEYRWNYGGGLGVTTIQNPTFTYFLPNNYTPSLRVTNSFGCNRTISPVSTNVRPTFPVPDFTVDSFACTNQAITFNDLTNAVQPTYLWDFGDGNTSTDANPTHSYSSEGTFSVSLTVTDLNGCDSSITMTDAILVANPVAAFTADTLFGGCGLSTVTFTDTSSNAVSRQWIFEDGTTSTQPTYTRTFTTGNYEVCMVAYGASGCTDTICKTNYINITEPLANFSFAPDTGCPTLDVTFSATGFGVENFIFVTGDGGLVAIPGTRGADTIQFTYPYQSGGLYVPALIAESDPGCQQVTVSPNFVDVEVFEIEIGASDTIICDAGTIRFTALPTSPIPVDTIAWTFSGGSISSSNDSIVDVSFSSLGTYTITLFSGNGTCSRSTTRTIQVVPSPNSDFSFDPTFICAPQIVNFTNNSSISAGNIVAQTWQYGIYGSDTSSNPSFVFSVGDTVPVNLVSVSELGCTDTTINDVIVRPTPNANAGGDFSVCIGETAQLSASGNGNYLWSPADAVDCDTCANPTIIIDSTTTYVLTVTNDEGCVDTDTLVVTLSPFSQPDITVSNDTTICKGDVAQIFVGGGTNVLDYEWDSDRDGLSCYIGCDNPFASPEVTTTFPVTLTGEGGCQNRDSITITVIQDTADIAGTDRTICEGDTIQLNTAFGNDPTWTPFNDISCVFCEDPLVYPLDTTDYVVEITTNNGCVVRDTVTINVIQNSSISAGEDQTICINSSTVLNGVGVGNISWNNESTLSNANIINPVASPTQTTDYILTVIVDNCTLKDTTRVNVSNGASVTTADAEICEGDSVQLFADGLAQTYTWSPAAGLSDPNAQNPIASPTSTTTYSVLAEIENCASDIATSTVTIYEKPTISGFPVQQVFAGVITPLALEVQINPTYTYEWSPAIGISCLECPEPDIDGSVDGIIYTLTVTNNRGCTQTDSVQIRLINGCSEELIVMPNAFTPNGDGLNDVLFVRGSSIQRINQFRVFSRNGDEVFYTRDKNEGWDGTFNGRELNTGVYVYYVEAFCELNGEIILKKGNVTLIRN